MASMEDKQAALIEALKAYLWIDEIERFEVSLHWDHRQSPSNKTHTITIQVKEANAEYAHR